MSFKLLKIRAKILLASFFIGFLPIIILGGFALTNIQHTLETQIFKQLSSLLEQKAEQLRELNSNLLEDSQELLQVTTAFKQNAIDKFKSLHLVQQQQLNNYIDERMSDVKILAASPLLKNALTFYEKESKNPNPNINWQELIAKEYDVGFSKYTSYYGYQDIAILNKKGEILFASNKTEYIGRSVFSEEIKDTSYKRAFEKGLKAPILEDFEYYPKAKSTLAFLASPILDEKQEVLGVLTLSLPIEKIVLLLQNNAVSGNTGHTYLVAKDKNGFSLRSYRRFDKNTESPLNINIDNALIPKYAERALNGEQVIDIDSANNNNDKELRLRVASSLGNKYLPWVIFSSVQLEEVITQSLQESSQNYFSKFIDIKKFHDLLLIDAQGKIFYTVRKEKDYRTNILTDNQADKTLSNLVQNVLNTKHFEISDITLYAPSNYAPAQFIAQPIMHGDKVALIVVLQLAGKQLEESVNLRGFGKTGEVYLVGNDFLMRSNSSLDPEYHGLQTSLDNPRKGRLDTTSVREALADKTGTHIIQGYLGYSVLSAYTPHKVGNETWALIAEISQEEAFSAMNALQTGIVIISAIALFISLLLVNRFTHQFVTPLLDIRTHLNALAKGKIIKRDLTYHAQDEISDIIESTRLLKSAIEATIEQTKAIAAGNYERPIVMLSGEDQLGIALSDMTSTLRQAVAQTRRQDWLKTGQAQLNEVIRGDQELVTLARATINFLCNYVKAYVGTFYMLHHPDIKHENLYLKLIASYAFQKRKNMSNEFEIGEGLVGQAALERQSILVNQLPSDYLHVSSSLGETHPEALLVMPFMFEEHLKGVIEMGFLQEPDEIQFEFLMQAMSTIGIVVQTAESRTQLQILLQQSQQQAEELQTQTEELQSQQEELRQANEELQVRTLELERQKEEVRAKNAQLEISQQAIEQKARELELTSKYKSEFLANMSHELRTPLNSLLILAQLLKENSSGSMSDKQVEYARTIHSAGTDLLSLINDILDLAKVEAGKLEAHPELIPLNTMIDSIEQRFRHVAEDKGLQFSIKQAPQIPTQLFTDSQRLKQILTNLLSNAIKFTEKGAVTLNITRPDAAIVQHLNAKQKLTLNPETTLAFEVHDSGIGIAPENQQLIFEAFQQADGTTSRRFGGTGLGLSISRQLSRLLGGDLRVDSELNKGSTFTLYLPDKLQNNRENKAKTENKVVYGAPEENSKPTLTLIKPAPIVEVVEEEVAAEPPPSSPSLTQSKESPPPSSSMVAFERGNDDRDNLQANDKVLLIVEDEQNFANLLLDLSHEKGFKCLMAADGQEGLYLAQKYKPNAIILDVGLPLLDGWSVMERLKDDPDTRHIPVHFMSAADHTIDARRMGAIGYLIKPVNIEELSLAFRTIEQFISKQVKQVLMVVSDRERQVKMLQMVENKDNTIEVVADLDTAQKNLLTEQYDCLIIDVDIEQGQGIKFLEQLSELDNFKTTPVIVYAERELRHEEIVELQHCEERLTIKPVQSPERLLDETTLFLHQIAASLSKDKRKTLQRLHDKESLLNGRKILLVDDDIRNTYALATFLEGKNMEVLVANEGQEALNLLREQPDINIVLMDIMMPGMDGYETMQAIRQQLKLQNLPIIALTAKAMKGDKTKCIEAGANDYLSKPVDTDKLLSLMRVWLYK